MSTPEDMEEEADQRDETSDDGTEMEEIIVEDQETPAEGNNVCDVDAVVGVKKEGTQIKYLIKWQGYGSEDNSWEVGTRLKRNPAILAMIEEFHKAHPDEVMKLGRKPRQRSKKWETVEEQTPSANDISYDREMSKDDECFGVKVGKLTGEAKGLIDLNHKVSQKELLLAKLNTGGRVTRTSMKKFLDTEKLASPTPIPKVESSTAEESIPKSKRGRKKGSGKKQQISALPDDTFTTEDAESSKEAPTSPPHPECMDIKEEVPAKTSTSQSSPLKRKLTPSPDENQNESDVGKKKKEKSKEHPKAIEKDNRLYGLPDFPILSRFPTLPPRPAFNNDNVVPETFRVYIETANAKAVRNMFKDISKESLNKLATTHYANNTNWLHMVLLKHKVCDGGHSADAILRFICHFMPRELLDEQQTFDHSTPIHLAVQRGSVCTLKILLNYRADVNIKNKRGSTPLQIAYERNDPMMVKYLLEAGARFNELESRESKKPAAHRREQAWSMLQTYMGKMRDSVGRARRIFLLNSELEEVDPAVSPPVQHLGFFHAGFSFDFNFEPYRIGSDYAFLMFLYVVSNLGEQWTARVWGTFNQARPPLLNGKEMKHAQDTDYPMVFHCTPEAGSNRVQIFGSPQIWPQLPLIVAHVVLVKKSQIKKVQIAPVEQEETILEQAPLCGPFM